MTTDDRDRLLQFLRAVEPLKSTPRSAWTASGEREAVAAHTWRLCLFAMLVAAEVPGIDLARLLQLCIVHDLAEAVTGDIPAPAQGASDKSAEEAAALDALTRVLPAGARDTIRALWAEYEAATSPEAQLAKGLDKLETILQHVQGRNPPDFDHAFNLSYGRRYTDDHPLLAALREPLDRETAALAARRTSPHA